MECPQKIILIYSSFLTFDTLSNSLVFVSSLIASIMIYTGAVIEVKKGLHLKLIYALFGPIGSMVVVLGFLSGLFQAKKDASVSWRGRNYSMKDHIQDSIRI
jgi:hypothetical protein